MKNVQDVVQVDLERDYVMKIRVKFTKSGYVKYVGHLDTMRLFQRAIKVAQLPVAYSQGFSPHSLVYFAMPLAVGMSSHGEYMEIVMQEDVTVETVRERLSKVLVPGITIVDVFEVEEKTASLMSLVQGADYTVYLKALDGEALTAKALCAQVSQSSELIVMKKGKKGIAPVDIKPLLLNYEMADVDGGVRMALKVCAGSSKNLNPDLFLKALLGERAYEAVLIREELYAEGEGGLVPLNQVGRI